MAGRSKIFMQGQQKAEKRVDTYNEESEGQVGNIGRVGQWWLPAEEEGDHTDPEDGAETTKNVPKDLFEKVGLAGSEGVGTVSLEAALGLVLGETGVLVGVEAKGKLGRGELVEVDGGKVVGLGGDIVLVLGLALGILVEEAAALLARALGLGDVDGQGAELDGDGVALGTLQSLGADQGKGLALFFIGGHCDNVENQKSGEGVMGGVDVEVKKRLYNKERKEIPESSSWGVRAKKEKSLCFCCCGEEVRKEEKTREGEDLFM